MTPKELRLAAALLDMSSNEFSNHGCNDIQKSLLREFTTEELLQLGRDYGEYNGDPEEEHNILRTGDFALMGLMARKLKTEAAKSE